MTNDPNMKMPDGSPVPEWATRDPLVLAALNLYSAVCDVEQSARQHFSSDVSLLQTAALAREKKAADVVAAVAKCKPPEPELTWERLKELEPRLAALERTLRERIRCGCRKKNWCANAAWYGYGQYREFIGPKEVLVRLVGWHRDRFVNPPPHDELLRTREAYDLAYDALYTLLPDCKRCGCM